MVRIQVPQPVIKYLISQLCLSFSRAYFVANLANLDATIKLFSPGSNPDAIPPKRAYRRTRYFAHNELSRLTQDALRTASGPLTSAEIADAIVQAKGMSPDDAAFKEIVAARALTLNVHAF
jgi:hypothetical protein